MLILSTVIFAPILIPIQYIEHFFLAIGQSANVSSQAAVYVRVFSPSIITFCWGYSYTQYAQYQGKTWYAFYATLGASVIHWFLAQHLAVTLDMKMMGVAISSCVHFVCRFLIGYACVRCDREIS